MNNPTLEQIFDFSSVLENLEKITIIPPEEKLLRDEEIEMAKMDAEDIRKEQKYD